MKKFILMVFVPVTICMAAILATGPNCGAGPQPSAPPAVCDTPNSKFMQLYSNATGTQFNTFQARAFEYSFKSSVNATVCAIGYQGMPAINGFAYYKMEILDASNNVLFTGLYSYPSATRGYRVPATQVNIVANTEYKIRRTLIDNLGSASNDVCFFKQIPGTFAPISSGTFTITGTATYALGTGGALVNTSTNGIIPVIDVVLQ